MTSSSSPLSRSTTWVTKPSVASRRTCMAVSLFRRASRMARLPAAKTRTFRPRKASMASMEAMSEGSATAIFMTPLSSPRGTNESRWMNSAGMDWMRSRSRCSASRSM